MRVEVSLDGQVWRVVASSADRIPPSQLRRQARLIQHVTTPDDTAAVNKIKRRVNKLDVAIARVPSLANWWVGTHQPITEPVTVLLGGNPQRKGAEVEPASLEVLKHLKSSYRLSSEADEGNRRLSLARWLVASDNPLTPRVLANRLWQFHFGQGIVDTPSDFGFMGSRPTHPELLDWLAQELLRNGWKVKPLHRQIMTSQTYRQSSETRIVAAPIEIHSSRNRQISDAAARAPKSDNFGYNDGEHSLTLSHLPLALQIDAEARWLWRFPSRRLSAEEVRDSMLHVSGQLDLTMGGPGFRLYDYFKDNVATYTPLEVHGPETYRRAVYHQHARSSRVDLLTDFDCPDAAFPTPKRSPTTTPLQALVLMNHSFSIDMAQCLVERLERETSTSEAQIRRAFALAYSRSPSDLELQSGLELIRAFGLRAFCRAVLNSHELIHLN